MVKNLKRHRKETRGDENEEPVDFFPVTYTLPADYSLFQEEFKRNPNTTWILKPHAKARGVGIVIMNKMANIRKWANAKWGAGTASGLVSGGASKETYIISSYIDNPLLIGGKKFDLRIYALVTSFRPLKASTWAGRVGGLARLPAGGTCVMCVGFCGFGWCYVNLSLVGALRLGWVTQVWLYREGFARFCSTPYVNDGTNLDNPFVHLTNVAIQKHATAYNDRHGGKVRARNVCALLRARSLTHSIPCCWAVEPTQLASLPGRCSRPWGYKSLVRGLGGCCGVVAERRTERDDQRQALL